MDYNYFEVLELSIDDIQDKDEATIKDLVNDAHTKLYALTIGAYANIPRPDGLTQAQWQKVLNDAKETLLAPQKRQKHIADLMPEAESTHAPETTETPESESTHAPKRGFFKYCGYVTYDFGKDYYPLTSLGFLWARVAYRNYRPLIAIVAGALAAGLGPYGIRTEFFYRLLVKLGFVSSGISVASIDFDPGIFLICCLVGFAVVTPFVRGVVYRRLGLMIKRLIMIGIVPLVLFLTVTFAEIFDFYASQYPPLLLFLPVALLIIFYYIVGYIRYTRNLTK